MVERKAVYAGTFDPITNGHIDIINRALYIFDHLNVAVSSNPEKKVLFSADERVNQVREALGKLKTRVTVEAFNGLLVNYVSNLGAKTIIRGLRAVTDYEYEWQMAVMNRQLDEEIETVFLMTSPENSFISSSVVKEIARNKGNVSGLVPTNVCQYLKGKFVV